MDHQTNPTGRNGEAISTADTKSAARKKCRVLCVIGTMGTGGSERQLIGLLRHLDRSRFAPRLYTVHAEGALLDEVPDDVPVHSFWQEHRTPRWNWPGRIHRMQVRHLASVALGEQADLIYDRTLVASLVAGPASLRTGIPHVSTIVARPAEDLEAAGRYRTLKWRLLRRSYDCAAKVTTVSAALREEAIAFYRLPEKQVVSLPNWIDLHRIDRLALEGSPQFAENRFHVVCVGRNQALKGQRFLLEAVAELVLRRGRSELMVHLLGEGPDTGLLAAWVSSRRLDSHVEFCGLKSNPYPYLRAADLFCLPSISEGMPNSLLEAMACRVPVLATDCPTGPREILDGGRLGRLVRPGDSMALADAIDDAMLNRDRWLTPVEDARRHVEECYGPATRLAEVESLFLSAVQGG
ncbi:MAG: glycosyltransferase [Thermoguttaceae bacterium]